MAAADSGTLDAAIARHRRLCDGYDALVVLDADARALELARLRAADPALADELVAMLDASQRDALQPRAAPASADAALGVERGWRVLREIGRGGMGRVLLAERADGRFLRQVALKVLDASPHDAEWRRRFHAEREILGRLAHPNIARLIDAGEAADGTPYLVMEYVDGVALDAWLARERPGLDARLELFGRIADAVAYAHQALVAHRDLKPANVLVDAAGEPHLLDFGIARSLADAQQTATAERALTPRWAAPEQVEGAVATAAVDRYQLGLLLYQMLADEPPFAAHAGAALLHAILHEEPPPPGAVARRRGLAHARRIDRELDAICLKALRKRADERYRSVDALHDDVARWRRGEPVQAVRGGRAYRARKFVRRHRRALAVAALLLALVAGFVWRLDAELARTERERALAQRTTDLMIDVFGQADPSRAQGQELTLREALDQSVERLRAERDVAPGLRARLLQEVGATYLALSQNTQAVALLGESVQAFRAAGDAEGEESAQHAQAVGLGNLGHFAEAQALVEPLIARRVARGVANDTMQAELHSYLAILHRYRRANDAVRREYQRAIEILRAIPAPGREEDEQLAHTLRGLGDAATDDGDDVAAGAALAESWALVQRLFPAAHPETIRTLRALGRNAQRRGDHDAALRDLEAGWAQAQQTYQAPDVVRTLLAHSLAGERLHRGEWAAAEALLRAALAEALQLYPGAHANPATLRADLARALLMQGADAEARMHAQAAVDARRELSAPDPQLAEAELTLALLDCRAGVADARAQVDATLARTLADARLAAWTRQDFERYATACPGSR